MKQVQINHATLVALQGRLRTITLLGDNCDGINVYDTIKAVMAEAEAGIREIDDWLIDPAMQAAPPDPADQFSAGWDQLVAHLRTLPPDQRYEYLEGRDFFETLIKQLLQDVREGQRPQGGIDG